MIKLKKFHIYKDVWGVGAGGRSSGRLDRIL